MVFGGRGFLKSGAEAAIAIEYQGVLNMVSISTRTHTDPQMVEEVLRRRGDKERIAHNIGSVIQRVSDASAQEIDRLIAELETLRDMLEDESVRIQREVSQYAELGQSAIQTTKIISEGLAKLR
jgi:hypothetical protein